MRRLGIAFVVATVLGAASLATAKDATLRGPVASPDMDAAAKSTQGTWKCAGTVQMPAPHPVKATMKFTRDLNGLWLVGSYAEQKTKENPTPYRFTQYRTYDATTKKWTTFTTDNTGGWGMATCTREGPKTTCEGKGDMMGQTVWSKATEEEKGPKEVQVAGQMSMDGKEWKPSYEATCKK